MTALTYEVHIWRFHVENINGIPSVGRSGEEEEEEEKRVH